jgi:uroporphyrinogen-III synthase
MQSLHGLRILNTRPEKAAKFLSNDIRTLGGLAIECPTIEIRATNNLWLNLLPDLKKVTTAIFVSANAVHFCFTELLKNQISWPSSINVIAIGNASARALEQFHIQVNAIPPLPDSEHLLALPSLQKVENQTILLFKGVGGRLIIEESLTKLKANLIKLMVYQREFPQFDKQWIDSIWRNDLVDIILITSLQSLTNLFKMFTASGTKARAWLLAKPYLVISERLATAAALLGIKNIFISHPENIINTLLGINL